VFPAAQFEPVTLRTETPTFETIPDSKKEHKAIILGDVPLLEHASIEVSICLEVSKE
jgi:hypothetical protein